MERWKNNECDSVRSLKKKNACRDVKEEKAINWKNK